MQLQLLRNRVVCEEKAKVVANGVIIKKMNGYYINHCIGLSIWQMYFGVE